MFEILKSTRILPVIVIHNEKDAVPLAEAIFKGGIHVLEITLRTDAALSAIQAITRSIPELIIGAGTVIEPEQLSRAQEAGAKFAVSPGITTSLLKTANELKLPYLPGVASSTEIMQALNAGFNIVKSFPTELLGGIKWITSQKALFSHLKFCPSGGISKANMLSYLASDAVITVGGTWLTPLELIKHKDWKSITKIVRETIAIANNLSNYNIKLATSSSTKSDVLKSYQLQ